MGLKLTRAKRKNILTKVSGLVIFVIVLVTQFQDKKWSDSDRIIIGDVQVYYAYLPAFFIHNDIDFKNPEVYHSGDHLRLLYAENPNGERYIRTTCGMSMAYSPFFFMGHAGAAILGEPMDGFSYPYMFALIIGSLIYLAIGLIFLSKLLLRHFDDRTVSITLLILYLGTNYLYYLTGTMLYAHGFGFTLFVVILYAAVRWLEEPTVKWSVLLGFAAGLMVLIRPVDVLFVAFLPLIGIFTFDQFKKRIGLFWKKRVHLLLILIAGLIILTPQFIYNYHLSGKLIFNLYAHSGEGFFFADPHLLDSWFSYRNGWLVYSPLMVFSLIGILLMLRSRNEWIRYVLPVFLIYWLILASWWCWWYAGFGNRAYINLYPILAIPLATCVHFFLERKFIVRNGFKLIVLAGILLSLFQTDQFDRGVIHWGEMTKDAYWSIFIKENRPELFTTYLRTPHVKDRKKGLDRVFEPKVKLIYQKDFSFDAGGIEDSSTVLFRENGVVKIAGETEFFADIPLPISSDVNEVYLTVWIKGADEGEMHILLMNSAQTFSKISSEVVHSEGEWKQFHCYVQITEALLTEQLHFKIWNQARKDLLMDRVRFQGRNRSFIIVDE